MHHDLMGNICFFLKCLVILYNIFLYEALLGLNDCFRLFLQDLYTFLTLCYNMD